MDSLLRHLHPLDAFEAEQELDLVDGRVRGHLLQDRPEGLLKTPSGLVELAPLPRRPKGVADVEEREPSEIRVVRVEGADAVLAQERCKMRIRH
jgi:hypothetical protein